MARGACARRPCAGRKIATTRARPSSDPPRPSEPARVHRSTLFENCDLFLTSCCCARLPVIIFMRIRRLHDLVSSGHTPLTPHEQPRAIPVTVLNIHFPTPTHYLTSTGRNNSFCGRPCSPCWCRMGRPDVGPCSTHPRGRAGSSAVRHARCHTTAAKSRYFRLWRENRVLRALVLGGWAQDATSRRRPAHYAP